MAFTYGFYNSLKGDRKYNSEQVSEIFDGILKDGIIPSIGQLFAVTTASNGMQINVGTGRAWFNHTWSKNDSVMVLTLPLSDISRNRYDAVVLEVNHNDDIRANSIKIVSGSPAVNAVKPALVNTEKIHQYPLAYILVKGGTDTVEAKDIENMVGRSPTVFATGVLETVSLDSLWSQWEGEWDDWFEDVKLQLSGNVATNLQLQIDQLRSSIPIKASDSEVITGTNTTKYATPSGVKAAINSGKATVKDQNERFLTVTSANGIPIKKTIDGMSCIDLKLKDYFVSYEIVRNTDSQTCTLFLYIANCSTGAVRIYSYSLPYYTKMITNIYAIALKGANQLILYADGELLKFTVNSSTVSKVTLKSFGSSMAGDASMVNARLFQINTSYSAFIVPGVDQATVYRIGNSSNSVPTEYLWRTPSPAIVSSGSYTGNFSEFGHNSTGIVHIYKQNSSSVAVAEVLSISSLTYSVVATASANTPIKGDLTISAYDDVNDYTIFSGFDKTTSPSRPVAITLHGSSLKYHYPVFTEDAYELVANVDTKNYALWHADTRAISGSEVSKSSAYLDVTRVSYINNTKSALRVPVGTAGSNNGYSKVDLVGSGYVLNTSYLKKNGSFDVSYSIADYISYNGQEMRRIETSSALDAFDYISVDGAEEFASTGHKITLYNVNSCPIIGTY